MKMKKWQAIVLTNSPIPTSFTTPVPEEQSSVPVEQCSPMLPPPPPVSATTSLSLLPQPTDYTTKYHVKYLVKHLVHQSMLGQGAAGPNQCSTPMPGRQVCPQLPSTPSVLTTQVMEHGGDVLKENRELLDRYVVKYFYKFKNQM